MARPSLEQIIRRYGRPRPIRSYNQNDPRSRIVELLEKGDTNTVLDSYEEDDPRCLNGLTWAHFLNDQFDEAERLALEAISTFSADLASAISHLALVKMRREGNTFNPEIIALFLQAIEIYPESHTAHINRLCYASRMRDTEELEKAIIDLQRHIPDWHHRQNFVELIVEDADLTWARTQGLFTPILNKINEVVK